jgi:hypothetical protein
VCTLGKVAAGYFSLGARELSKQRVKTVEQRARMAARGCGRREEAELADSEGAAAAGGARGYVHIHGLDLGHEGRL